MGYVRVCVYVCVKRFYYKELPHAVMEASSKICKMCQQAGDPGRSWCSSSLKTGRLEMQEEPTFSSSPKAAKNQCPSSKAIRQEEFSIKGRSAFLFYLGLQLIGHGPPT